MAYTNTPAQQICISNWMALLFIQNGFPFNRNKVFLSIRIESNRFVIVVTFQSIPSHRPISKWYSLIRRTFSNVFEMMTYKWLNEADTKVWTHSNKNVYTSTQTHSTAQHSTTNAANLWDRNRIRSMCSIGNVKFYMHLI